MESHSTLGANEGYPGDGGELEGSSQLKEEVRFGEPVCMSASDVKVTNMVR